MEPADDPSQMAAVAAAAARAAAAAAATIVSPVMRVDSGDLVMHHHSHEHDHEHDHEHEHDHTHDHDHDLEHHHSVHHPHHHPHHHHHPHDHSVHHPHHHHHAHDPHAHQHRHQHQHQHHQHQHHAHDHHAHDHHDHLHHHDMSSPAAAAAAVAAAQAAHVASLAPEQVLDPLVELNDDDHRDHAEHAEHDHAKDDAQARSSTAASAAAAAAVASAASTNSTATSTSSSSSSSAATAPSIASRPASAFAPLRASASVKPRRGRSSSSSLSSSRKRKRGPPKNAKEKGPCSCRAGCYHQFDSVQRERLRDQFWELSYNDQQTWLARHSKRNLVDRDRDADDEEGPPGTNYRREMRTRYTLPSGPHHEPVKVCSHTFMSILGVGDTRLRNLSRRMLHLDEPQQPRNKRARKSVYTSPALPANKIPSTVIDRVHRHINLRNHHNAILEGKKRGAITIKEMHRDYLASLDTSSLDDDDDDDGGASSSAAAAPQPQRVRDHPDYVSYRIYREQVHEILGTAVDLRRPTAIMDLETLGPDTRSSASAAAAAAAIISAASATSSARASSSSSSSSSSAAAAASASSKRRIAPDLVGTLCKCKRRCYMQFSLEERQRMRDYFASLEYSEQQKYINRHADRLVLAPSRKGQKQYRRNVRSHYKLGSAGRTRAVCTKTFMVILDVGETRLRNLARAAAEPSIARLRRRLAANNDNNNNNNSNNNLSQHASPSPSPQGPLNGAADKIIPERTLHDAREHIHQQQAQSHRTNLREMYRDFAGDAPPISFESYSKLFHQLYAPHLSLDDHDVEDPY